MAFRAGPPATASDAAPVNVHRTVARMALLPGQQCMIVHPLRRGFIPTIVPAIRRCASSGNVPVSPGSAPDAVQAGDRAPVAFLWTGDDPAVFSSPSAPTGWCHRI